MGTNFLCKSPQPELSPIYMFFLFESKNLVPRFERIKFYLI